MIALVLGRAHRLLKALNTWAPAASGRHTLTNGAVPGTGPNYFEHCLRSHLPRSRVDLVIVEFAVSTPA